jgi:hypothetical protein
VTEAKRWTIATARQHLPELVRRAAEAPQRVYRRDKLVAAVINPAMVDGLERQNRPGIGAKLAELQQICSEENYQLTTPPRRDRANPLGPREATRSIGRTRRR